MTIRKVNLIEFPSNLGLKEPSPGNQPGVSKLPSWLKKYGFYAFIENMETYSLQPPPYSMQLDSVSNVMNADAIVEYAKQQAVLIHRLITGNDFQLIIGGDCSILIGIALALKKEGNYGLFFLDGHTDFITPDLSETNGAAGMDLAIVTGNGHKKLTNIDELMPYFDEQNVWCVGNREYDEAYLAPMYKSGIHFYDLKTLRRTGIVECINKFFDLIKEKKLDGFFIHFDVDVLNDEIMPAVDSRQKDGLSYFEVSQILKKLLVHEKVMGLEITILDPDLDPDGKYTSEFVENIGSLIKNSLFENS